MSYLECPFQVKHGSLILPSLPSSLPAKIGNTVEAAEVCQMVRSMLTLMMNQHDRLLSHAAASSFALVVHLATRILPMPLPVDDEGWPQACFWAGEPLTLETKRDLLRNLHGVSRYFSAAASAVSAVHATREMDGARTCVSAALVAMMDALLRRPLDLRLSPLAAVQERHGDLFSLHYSGKAGGPGSPCRPFILSSGTFRETSKALLLPQPELALLRAQTLDYFESLEKAGSKSDQSGSLIFNFDKSMVFSDSDRPRLS